MFSRRCCSFVGSSSRRRGFEGIGGVGVEKEEGRESSVIDSFGFVERKMDQTDEHLCVRVRE